METPIREGNFIPFTRKASIVFQLDPHRDRRQIEEALYMMRAVVTDEIRVACAENSKTIVCS